MRIIKISIDSRNLSDSKPYRFVGTCKNAYGGDASIMQSVTHFDPQEYGQTAFGHPEAFRITQERFESLTGKKFKSQKMFYGFNEEANVVFAYDPNKDLHYFFEG